jgi:hypothetical protein
MKKNKKFTQENKKETKTMKKKEKLPQENNKLFVYFFHSVEVCCKKNFFVLCNKRETQGRG